jgi:hypothetical protein
MKINSVVKVTNEDSCYYNQVGKIIAENVGWDLNATSTMHEIFFENLPEDIAWGKVKNLWFAENEIKEIVQWKTIMK